MNYLQRNNNLYIISSLNEHSLLLASSIKSNDKTGKIIFTDVLIAKNNYLQERAKKLHCKLMSNNIRTLSETLLNASVVRCIFNDTEENINVEDALFIAQKYRNRITAELFVFASSRESECLLDAIDKGNSLNDIPPLKIRRVDVVRNQIYTELLNNSIYENALLLYNEKIISVLLVGLGNYGTEMLKALLWCGQMPGYVLKINVVDITQNAEDKFYSCCPGIRQRGTQPKSGEDYYELSFYCGIDAFSESFSTIVQDLYETTNVFISLGDEQKNIELSLKLRTIFSGIKIDAGDTPAHSKEDIQTPKITTVVHNDQKATLLNNNELRNFKNQYYNIRCIGVDNDVYSFNNIFASKLETMALKAHLQWGSVETFNNFEYYRRSSMASAIFKKYRDKLIGSDKKVKDMYEHIRWNAYMRSTEGYAFGYIRDDLALRHSSLVKFDLLSFADKEKDSHMNLYETDTE